MKLGPPEYEVGVLPTLSCGLPSYCYNKNMRLVDPNCSGEINQTASLPAGVTLLSICYVGVKLN